MKKKATPVDGLHVLFPYVRARLVQFLFGGHEGYVRELARECSCALGTVQQELARLERAGLLLSRSDGWHRFYYANRQHRLYAALREIATKGKSDRAFVRTRKRPRPPRSQRRRRDRLQSSPFLSSLGINRSQR